MGSARSDARGSSGEIAVSDNDWRNPLTDAFIASAATAGINHNPNYNDGLQGGSGYYQRFIHRGWRVSSSSALRAALRRVDVRVETKALRVIVEGGAAGAVLVECGDQQETIRASGEIIVCAETLNTPHLLQLSGIGPPDLLAGLGLPCVVASPGVGRNLQDHYSVRVVAAVRGKGAINQKGRGISAAVELLRWLCGKPSILAVSPAIAYAFASTVPGNMRPDVQCFFSPAGYRQGYNSLDREPSVTCGVYPLRPMSRGFVEAMSPDHRTAPRIQPNYLDHPEDQATLLRATGLARRIFEASPMRRHVVNELDPGPNVTRDDEILDYARRFGTSSVHLVGTARMGPADDRSAVVDNCLRVRGCERLRVADASIMPKLISGNTAAPTLMIAERAASLIGQAT